MILCTKTNIHIHSKDQLHPKNKERVIKKNSNHHMLRMFPPELAKSKVPINYLKLENPKMKAILTHMALKIIEEVDLTIKHL